MKCMVVMLLCVAACQTQESSMYAPFKASKTPNPNQVHENVEAIINGMMQARQAQIAADGEQIAPQW